MLLFLYFPTLYPCKACNGFLTNQNNLFNRLKTKPKLTVTLQSQVAWYVSDFCMDHCVLFFC